MTDQELAARPHAAIKRRGLIPPRERYEDLIRRGVINRDGTILSSMPLPPFEEYDEARRELEAEVAAIRRDLPEAR